MRTLRRHLMWIIGASLACQLAALAAAPLAYAGLLARPDGEALLCTCAASGPDHDCPMHGRHNDEAAARQDAHDCTLRSGSAPSEVTLASLLGGIGVLPLAPAVHSAPSAAEPVAPVASGALSRADRPDAPPPRLT